MKRLAVVGTGNMAHIRTRAFLSLGPEVSICGVASGRLERARMFAEAFGCPNYTDDYRDLALFKPDAVLVEVPHEVQDEIVLWSLEQGFHTLVGGCLATRAEVAEQIVDLSQSRNVVVEAGYEARYKEVWELTKELVASEAIGRLVAVRSVALYPAPPSSWYYSERASGGMVLTHMSYAFINPLRWILGSPRALAAFANKKHQTGQEKVKHEMCSANFLFDNDVICNMVAGYVKPKGLDAWQVDFIGTMGSLSLYPGDLTAGSLTVCRDDQPPVRYEVENDDAFAKQAKTFVGAVDGHGPNLNPAHDAAIDVRLADLIVRSIEERSTLDCDFASNPEWIGQ